MSVANVASVDTIYAIRIDTVSSTLTYIGEASVGANNSDAIWRIRKLETVGTVLSVQWADGDFQFDNVWDNRASLTYI